MAIPHDVTGNIIRIGDRVVRSVLRGNSPVLLVCTVTDVVGDDVYLDGSKKAIIFNDRISLVKE